MNWQLIFNVCVVVVVGGLFLYNRYHHNRARLERDLERLVTDGLEQLKAWAGEQLDAVSREQVWAVADELYERYVVDSSLAKVADKTVLRSLLWGAFCRWRDRFLDVNAAMIDWNSAQ